MHYKVAPAEFKAGDDGAIHGHAAIFGNRDLGSDIIEAGAFKEFVTNEQGRVVMLWQHNTREPLGTAKVWQDDRGLAFSGQLVLADPLAVKALAHIRAGSVRGMSIGFDILPGGAAIDEKQNARRLSALKVWEVSPVTFGMNPLARVQAGAVKSRTDLERMARDVLGMTRSKARKFSQAGWDLMSASGDDAIDMEDLLLEQDEFLNSIRKG